MKTRLILYSLLLLAGLAGCVENNQKQASHTPTADTGYRLPSSEKPAEQMTEELFYGLVRELSAGNKTSETLVCTEYPNEIQAFSFIITLISPDDARKVFAKTTRYESERLTLAYTQRDAEDRFAELTLKFKKRRGQPLYTVIFASGNQ